MENIINDGTTTYETRLGAVADLELAISSKKISDDIMVVSAFYASALFSDVDNESITPQLRETLYRRAPNNVARCLEQFSHLYSMSFCFFAYFFGVAPIFG